ncbi:ABC transporter permease [Nocardiopsis sp. NPDC006139]|uniref:ABC transporter permease n=1 Tax=unclassified Nocardiopsis TaxID=2649073 RepID=UPI0033BBE4A4
MNRRALRAGADRFRTGARLALASPDRLLLDFQLLFVLVYGTTCMVAAPREDSDFFITSPSSLAMTFLMLVMVQSGTFAVAQAVLAARADGTLLRLRLLPGGLQAYVVEKCLHVLAVSAVSIGALLGLAFTVGGLSAGGPAALPGALGSLVLGLLFFVALGLLLGAVLPAGGDLLSYSALAVYVPAALAGTGAAAFFPEPLRAAVRVLPFEWIANGVDAGLTGGTPLGFGGADTWNPLAAAAVTAVWTALLLAAAVPLLRRMTRRASGSAPDRTRT